MNFRLLFEMLNASEHFNQGTNIEVLKGYFKRRSTLREKIYWGIRTALYKDKQ